jgi:CheY-like chemotaxis protein
VFRAILPHPILAAEDIAMPEEKEQVPDEGQNPSSLDQETLDQILAESQGDTDQLESMLNNLEDNAEAETAPGSEKGADLSELANDMEAMLERMESDDPDEPEEDADVSELNDMLYQATLADVEQSQPEHQEDVLESDATTESEIEEAEPADDDLEALLEDVEEDAEEEPEDLAALLEDSEEEAEPADDDLEALLEDVEEEAEEEAEGDSADLDALLEDAEEEPELADDDLEALLEDVEEDAEEDSADLDALLEDAEEEPELVDDDLEALLEDVEEDAEDGNLEAVDDIDDLLADMDYEEEDDPADLLDEAALDAEFDDDLDDLLDDFEGEDEPLNVGIEDEVAQILATGESLNGDSGILDDFKSVQESIITSPNASGDVVYSTLLMIDGDPDQRSLFEDALGGQFGFAEADTVEEAIQTISNEQVDLIVLSLDHNDDGSALDFVEQVNASLDMPSIPIIVTSEHNDRIEKALPLGAVDYITCPLDVMDIEFQLPQKVANQMKLQKAERILAGVGEPSVMGSGSLEVANFDLEEEVDLDFDGAPRDEDEDEFLFDDDAAPEDLLVRRSSRKDPLVPLSDQQKILRNRQATRRDVSRIPLFAVIFAFFAATAGAVYQYADELKELLPFNEQTITQAPPRPKQPLPKVKMPAIPKQSYASTSSPTPPAKSDNIYQQQASVLKSRIRQNVNQLADSGGAWWSPWRVLRSSGASVGGLVDRQSVQNVVGAFGVGIEAVERGLQSRRTLDYLASVGFDMRGKDAADLSAREAFELLSARQIKNADQIVEVLSKLTDGLAADRTAQEENNEKERRKRKGQAMLSIPQDRSPGSSQTVTATYQPRELKSENVIHNGGGKGWDSRVDWRIKQRV